MRLEITALGFGIVDAAILALASVGFTMQFAITNIFNLAFGGQMTLCALIAYALNRAGAGIWLAFAAAGVIGAAMSWALNRGLYAPFLKRKGTTSFSMVVVSLSMLLIMQFTAQAIWGTSFFSYTVPPHPPIRWGSFTLTYPELVIICVAVVAMVVVHVLLSRTRLGKAMRAMASDRDLAACSGIPVSLVADAAWLISGALAGMAGVGLAISLSSFDVNVGGTYLLAIIAAAVLGGIGNAYGAMIGALVIGISVQESSIFLTSTYSEVTAFVILIVMLLVRPAGLLPGVARVKGVAA